MITDKEFWERVGEDAHVTAYGKTFDIVGFCRITRRVTAIAHSRSTHKGGRMGQVIKIPFRHISHINEISQAGVSL